MRTETVKDIFNLFENAEIMIAYHDLLCRNFIDEGCSRIVYECDYDKSCVVKIHKDVDDRLPSDNILEWELWNIVKDMRDDINKWFAPCVRISENGRILIQKKTTPLTAKQWDNLKEVPTFLSDIKMSNFGMYKNHVCMHDYAFSIYRLKINKKMRKISPKDRNRY